MLACLFPDLVRRSFLRADTDAFDLNPRQLSAVSDGAMITLTPFELKRDHFFIFALLDDFGGDPRAWDERIAVREVFPVGEHQDIAERCGPTCLDVEKTDIDRVALRHTILPAASLDNCVSHKRFPGRKSRAKFHGQASLASETRRPGALPRPDAGARRPYFAEITSTISPFGG